MMMWKKLQMMLLVVAVLAGLSSQAWASGESVIPVGRSQLVEVTSDMGEVIVANPDIADVYVHGKRKISVIGKSLGRTSVRVFDTEHKLIRSMEVTVGYDLPAIRQALKDLLPYEMVGVKMVNTNIALTGEISSTSAADQAVEIVKEYVEPAYGLNASKGEEDAEPKIINLLQIATGQQVMLRVRVGEIKRSALKNLGVNLQAIKNGGDTVFALATGAGVPGLTQGSNLSFGQFTSDTNNYRGFSSLGYRNSSGNGVSAMLEALERDGLFKVLAEPNLVAMSGEEAKFPVPVPQQLNQITIQFKPFGVSVNFKPTVLAENRIRIMVEPEVSEITNEGALQVQGFNIPALRTRRAKTTLELAPGESFMIAGLLLDQMESTIDQIPGLSEVPILSALFRSTAYRRQETELVLAVTPYLVDPMLSSDVKLPTDGFKPASAMESFFYGALGATSGETSRISQMPTVEGPIGFMVD
jgi:pilus assembly protein CpaC